MGLLVETGCESLKVHVKVAGRYAPLWTVVTLTLSATGTRANAREGAVTVTESILSEEEGREGFSM